MTCIVEIAYLLLFKSTTNSIIATKCKEVRILTSCYRFSSSPNVTMELFTLLSSTNHCLLFKWLVFNNLQDCFYDMHVRMRKLSISKAGRNNESHNMTPRADSLLNAMNHTKYMLKWKNPHLLRPLFFLTLILKININ